MKFVYTSLVMYHLFAIKLLFLYQTLTLSKSLHYKGSSSGTQVNVLNVISGGLKVAGCIVALAQEDAILLSTFQWLVNWDWWTDEHL
jgi:hypothetical protein